MTRYFTVFTATWNRCATLPRVYESLTRQTFHDFEWIIVDDGSSDNTAAVVERWQAEAPFPIRYYWQPRGGKHRALERGIAASRGYLLVSLDSDDECVPEALERFRYHWEGIPAELRTGFFGVAVLARNEQGELVGNRFPRDILDSDASEIRYRYRVTGDKWAAMRTDVLRGYPFPSVEGLLYVPDAIVWSAIARQYKLRCVNEVLLICWSGPGAAANRQSTATSQDIGAPGNALWHRTVLNQDIRWFSVAPMQILKSAVFYSRFSCLCRTGIVEQYRSLSNGFARLLWFIGLPLGSWLCYRDHRLERGSANGTTR